MYDIVETKKSFDQASTWISVFTEKGTTKIGLMKPEQMRAVLSQDAALTQVAKEVEEATRNRNSESKWHDRPIGSALYVE
jgi:hypothetical protein